LGETDYLLVDFRNEFLQGCSFVGSLAVKHLIEDDSHRPYIALGGVGASVEDLGAHVHGGTHQTLMDLVKFSPLLVVLGKAEVSDFVGFIFDKNVGWFEVAVDDRVLVEVLVALNELFDDDESL